MFLLDATEAEADPNATVIDGPFGKVVSVRVGYRGAYDQELPWMPIDEAGRVAASLGLELGIA